MGWYAWRRGSVSRVFYVFHTRICRMGNFQVVIISERQTAILGPTDRDGEAFRVDAFGLFPRRSAERLAAELGSLPERAWRACVSSWQERFKVDGSCELVARFVSTSDIVNSEVVTKS